MKKTAEYRRHAEECRKLADGTVSGEDRTRLLDMAAHWVDLAAVREALLAKHPELDRSGVSARAEEPAPPQPLKGETVNKQTAEG